MILFRPHRGSLEDSMKLVREVNNISELLKEVKSEFMFGELMDIDESNIEINPYCFDDMITGSTHVVILVVGDERLTMGFTNGNFSESDNGKK